MNSPRRTSRGLRKITAAVAVMALVGLWAVPGAAHVVISDSHTTDGTTSITFFFDHGCDGSPTTALAVQLPDGAEVNATEEPDGWSLQSDEDVVEWEGPGIDDHEPAEFIVALTGVDTSHDQAFPVIQTCEVGEAAWIDDDPDSAYPAPVLAAGGEPSDHDHSHNGDDETDETTTTTEAEPPATTEAPDEIDGEAAAATGDDDDGAPVAAIVIAIIVVIAVVGGIFYFVRSRGQAA